VTGRFTDDLYQLLAKDNANKNLISSPLSVDIALSMVYMAAGGKTAQEMRSVLKLPSDKKEVARKYKDFLTMLVSAVFVPCVYLQAHHVKITQIQPETNPNHSNTSPRDKPLN